MGQVLKGRMKMAASLKKKKSLLERIAKSCRDRNGWVFSVVMVILVLHPHG